MNRKLFGKYDIIIILLLAAAAFVLLVPKLFSDEKVNAVIYQNGKEIKVIDLSAVEGSYEIKLDGAIIFVEKNAISFKDADCPDKLCVKCGKLTHPGDTAVCVPTATVIALSGSGSEIDAVSY